MQETVQSLMGISLQEVNLHHARKEPPGSKLTPEQEAEQKKAKEEFWKPKKPGAKRRPKRLIKIPDRLPTLGVMRTLDNALFQGLGIRLWAFKFTLERANELKALLVAGRVTVEMLCQKFGFLCLWCDRASQQWAAGCYLQYREKLLVAFLSDQPAHQHWNGCLKGLKASQHESVLREMTPVANWTAAPFNKSQRLSESAAAALDLSVTIKADDRLLLQLWPFISEEQALEDRSALGRKEWIEKNRQKRKQRSRKGGPSPITKGEYMRFNEWYGLHHSMKNKVKPKWHSWVLLITYLCMCSGEVRRAYELFDLASHRGDLPNVLQEDDETTSDEEEGQEGAAAKGKAKPKPKTAAAKGRHNPKAKAKARLNPKQIRKQASSTLKFVLEMLSSRYLYMLCSLFIELVNPCAWEHGNLCVYMRGADRVKRTYFHWAMGTWKYCGVAIFNVLFDLGSLKRCWLTTLACG